MKRSLKYFALFSVMSLILSVCCAAAAVTGASLVEQSDRTALIRIISNIRKNYPDVTDEDIAVILNDDHLTDDVNDKKDLLRKYGITEEDPFVYNNEKNFVYASLLCGGVCIAGSGLLLAVFVMYVRKQRKEENRLTEHLMRINSGQYELPTDNMSESNYSVLEDEIYKTTVTLRKQTEQSVKDKENLKESVSDISHQLKTPITSMMIMLDDLTDDEDMPEDIRREFLHDIKRSASHMGFLTQSMLTLARLEVNSIEFHNKPEKVSDIIRTCIENTEVIAEVRGVEVTDSSDDITLSCDFKWICEAITNIVKNCIEHTPDGGRVSIKAGRTALFTRISIKDNGSGIDKDDLPHIFERFYKGKNSAKDSIGIGLSMSKAIIEKSGGYIKVISAPDKGSEFIITFYKE